VSSFIRSICLLSIVTASFPAFAQSGSPQAALEDLATATNVETVLRHLPVSVERAIAQMSPEERAAIEDQLVIARKLKQEGVELHRGADASTWEAIGPADTDATDSAAAPRKKFLITIKSAMENGNDALVMIDFHPDTSAASGEQSEPIEQKSALLWMKFEHGEWRITHLGEVERVKVEDALLKGLPSKQAANQASAVGALRTITTAIITYQSTYENIGLPVTIAAMACPANENCDEASPEHAGLLDSSFSASPLIRNGYQFEYTRLSSDHYTVTATPVAIDADAPARSFFTDESGVIRVTQENRTATAHDPPLQ
jgi:hypothetical protein